MPPIVHDVLRSPGQPLDADTRAFMEPRFGRDFGTVRVHTGPSAAESARAVNSLAYAVGRDVVFGAGQYSPETQAGRRLMAHELMHVVQQANTQNDDKQKLVLGDANSSHEREADRTASGISADFVDNSSEPTQVRVTAAPAGLVQRIGPAAAAAGGAVAGAVAAIVSFEAALAYAQSLATQYPGWLSVMPNCPCKEADTLADTATWGKDKNPALSWFHPGAASSYRSNAAFTTVPGSSHGQQCTYDSGGNLLTEGPGAGTPDSWSPNTNGFKHSLYDVATWQLLGWRIYTQYWQPNNGNSCAANRGDNTRMRRFSEWLP